MMMENANIVGQEAKIRPGYDAQEETAAVLLRIPKNCPVQRLLLAVPQISPPL